MDERVHNQRRPPVSRPRLASRLLAHPVHLPCTPPPSTQLRSRSSRPSAASAQQSTPEALPVGVPRPSGIRFSRPATCSHLRPLSSAPQLAPHTHRPSRTHYPNRRKHPKAAPQPVPVRGHNARTSYALLASRKGALAGPPYTARNMRPASQALRRVQWAEFPVTGPPGNVCRKHSISRAYQVRLPLKPVPGLPGPEPSPAPSNSDPFPSLHPEPGRECASPLLEQTQSRYGAPRAALYDMSALLGYRCQSHALRRPYTPSRPCCPRTAVKLHVPASTPDQPALVQTCRHALPDPFHWLVAQA